jgi:hypothetical protein
MKTVIAVLTVRDEEASETLTEAIAMLNTLTASCGSMKTIEFAAALSRPLRRASQCDFGKSPVGVHCNETR